MKRSISNIFLLAMCAVAGGVLLFSSCTPEEKLFDEPYVYVTDENNTTGSEIGKTAVTVSTYWVYLSSEKLAQKEEVTYELVVGDGLQEGVDFKRVAATSSPLVFLPGIYELPVRIEWLNNPNLDPNKDNTLRIVLTGTSSNFTLGYPGPAHLYKEYTITKK